MPNSSSYQFIEGWEHQDSNNKDWEGPYWGRDTNVTLWVEPFGPIQYTVVATCTSEIITRINMLYACTPLFCETEGIPLFRVNSMYKNASEKT